jgi:4-oxalocrotonate tautomerase
MPFINVRTLKGALDADQKRLLQTRLTDLMVEIEGKGNPAFRQFVWVMIEEEEPSHWSMGGNQLSIEAFNAVARPRKETSDA